MKGILDNVIELHRYYDVFEYKFVSHLVTVNGKYIDVTLSDSEMDAFKQLFPNIKIYSSIGDR